MAKRYINSGFKNVNLVSYEPAVLLRPDQRVSIIQRRLSIGWTGTADRLLNST